MNAYLLYGPENGRFIQVPGTFPPKILRFPVPLDENDDESYYQVAEYHLDSVLPLPPPLRAKVATYRYRETTQQRRPYESQQ